jgi:predicted ArsR family transcriptional regulator
VGGGTTVRTPRESRSRGPICTAVDLRNNSVVKFPTDAAERVARALAARGPSTAAALAGELGTSATAVRRPLRALQEANLVQALDRAPYGPGPRRGRGRPSAVFTLTDAGRAACDQAYDALSLEALRFIAERDGREAVAAFAAQRARRVVGTNDVGNIDAVARRLTEQGFAATVEPLAQEGAQLCQHHCPVVEAAAEFPELCEAETQALSAVLGTHVTRLATLAHGDGICTTLVPEVAGSTQITPKRKVKA